ncbi:MAG: hypothetical protein AAF430_01455 [Myxococcota bacterium]
MRDDFTKPIKETLAKRVANRCSNPDCLRITSGPHIAPDRSVNVGIAAHITAAAAGGPRYDASLTPEERAAAENGIWLCSSCAALIDRDESLFPVERIRQWKEHAESRTRRELQDLRSATQTGSTVSDATKRARDLKQLRELLHCIDCAEIDRFIDALRSRRVVDGIWDYYDSSDGLISSTLFHVSDPNLDNAVMAFHEAWNATLKFGDWFVLLPDGRTYRFMRRHEGNDKADWPAAIDAFDAAVSAFDDAYRRLVDLIRADYAEIDLTQTSAKARQLVQEWHKRFEERMRR